MRTFIVLLLFQSALGAQMLPVPTSASQTQTFGMTGVAANQTARLNALNSAPQPSGSAGALPAPSTCKVTLQIFDDQGTKLQELVIDNLSPGKAINLDYARPSSTTPAVPLRIQVRGVVTISSAFASTIVAVNGPAIIAPAFCSVVPTLEVFDSDTGKTQVILANASSVPVFTVGTFAPGPATLP